jgi:hypothetical protein
MSNDNTCDTQNGQPVTDTDLIDSEKYTGTEKEADNEGTILTTTNKSKIKIIKNSDCKSWTYHKGDLL